MKKPIKPKSESGSAGAGVLLLFSAILIAFLLAGEFFYAFGVKHNIEIELSRAANIAVDLAMSDTHRQERISVLNADIAYNEFYMYLYNNMKLSPSLEAYAPGGGLIFSLEIAELSIDPSPPGISVSAAVAVQPLFLGRAAPAPLRFAVRGSSINRRKD